MPEPPQLATLPADMRRTLHGRRLGALLTAGALLAAVAAGARAQRRPARGVAHAQADWRFTDRERTVKVVLLAGSIGAYQDQPYGRLLYEWCDNAEIQNLSQVGAGAPQLLSRFRQHVLSNPNVPFGWRGAELWLLYGGGLNSAGAPATANHAAHRLFRLAHRRGMRVAALSLTPWATDGESDPRWAGAGALRALEGTRRVVDFVMGRLSPRAALGGHASARPSGVEPGDPWQPEELPDVAVDLYDSPLRDAGAPRRPLSEARAALEADPRWRRATRELSDEAREARLARDAARLAEAPRWALRTDYRGFDHVHPNRAGHRVIARTACPRLPESWGCRCP